MRLIPLSLLFLMLVTFLTSCSNEAKERNLKEKFNQYANQNQQVIFSGKINIKDILQNADYQHIPKLNNLISKEILEFNQGIHIDSGIYFSVEGLLDHEGNPLEVHVFATLKNKDSIQDKIASLGLMLEHGKNLDYALGNSYGVGIQGNVVVFHFQKQGAITQNQFSTIFQRLNQVKALAINNQSFTKGTIELHTHIDHIYELYKQNHAISLDKIKLKEVEQLLKNATLTTTLTFEGGGITIKTKHHFSESLKKRMIFDSHAANSLGSLAKGNVTLGVSMHLDPMKIQTLIEDFNPDFFEELGQTHGNIAFGMLALGNRPVSNLLGGQLTLLYYGEDNSHSAYIALGDEGKSISHLMHSFFSTNPLYNLNIHEKAVVATSKTHVISQQQLILPVFANDFGTHGFDLFMDVTEYNSKQPVLVSEYPFLNVISWVKITATNEGSTIRIQGKDSEQGILKQVVDLYVEQIKKQFN